MFAWLGLIGLVMQGSAQVQPPQILQIYRDHVKPEHEAVYREIEEEAARICAALGCPHPYLGIESLSGPKEVWYLNGYGSSAEVKQVANDYQKNAALMSALTTRVTKPKAGLALEPLDVFAHYRPDLSRGAPWSVGRGRFLVITVTNGNPRMDGTAFEAPDGTRFVVLPAQTREEADANAAAAGQEARVFAVRPSWSMAAQEWIAADPTFWRRLSER